MKYFGNGLDGEKEKTFDFELVQILKNCCKNPCKKSKGSLGLAGIFLNSTFENFSIIQNGAEFKIKVVVDISQIFQKKNRAIFRNSCFEYWA